jgi:hypothetical protein
MNPVRIAIFLLAAALSLSVAAEVHCADKEISLQVSPAGHPCVAWGVARLETALTQAGYRLSAGARTIVKVAANTHVGSLTAKARKPEGYRLVMAQDGVQVVGFDAAGAMYGCMELARRVRESGRLPSRLDVSDAPALSLRGVCVFLMKLGTYDYPVTPKEFPFFYDKTLWLQYLDYLAENRFNYVAFWNGHPFDYFV